MQDTTATPGTFQEKRYALVVGVNGSSNMPFPGPLRGAEDDARTMAEVLQQACGCELVREPLIGAQANTQAVRAALKTLGSKRSQQDLLIFYFAGHGSLHEEPTQQRQVYLVTSKLRSAP